MKNEARRIATRTALSVTVDDQCPMPCRTVSWAATAFCSAAIAGASAASAIVRNPGTRDLTPQRLDLSSRTGGGGAPSARRGIERLEDEAEAALRLTREAAAASQIRQHEERRSG